MNEKNRKVVFSGTIIIVVVGIIAKFASFIAEAVLAAFVGTSYQADAYYMVSSIQQVIYPMLSVGIWKVFLPIYKSKLAINKDREADYFANTIIVFFTGISLVVVVALALFGNSVVSIVAPGFTGQTRNLCISLVRISSPMYIFIVASAVYAAMLQCHNSFLGSQIREVASHIPIIIAAIFFFPRFGIYSLAYALIVAGALRLFVQFPFIKWDYKFKLNFSFKNKDFKVLLKRLPSALFSEGVLLVNALVDKAMASSLVSGAVSALNYGNKLMNVFSGLLSTAIGTALYPNMVELIALNDLEELEKTISKILRVFCLLMIPVTFGCVLFGKQMVTVVYARGAFDDKSIALTTTIFIMYSIGMLFTACTTILNNVFYGYGDTKTPLLISICSVVMNIILNIVLGRIIGAGGLALATSLTAIVTMLVNLFGVRRRITIKCKPIIITAGKCSIASVVSCGFPKLLFEIIRIENSYITLGIAAVLSIALYFFFLKIFKEDEVNYINSLIHKKRKNNTVKN